LTWSTAYTTWSYSMPEANTPISWLSSNFFTLHWWLELLAEPCTQAVYRYSETNELLICIAKLVFSTEELCLPPVKNERIKRVMQCLQRYRKTGYYLILWQWVLSFCLRHTSPYSWNLKCAIALAGGSASSTELQGGVSLGHSTLKEISPQDAESLMDVNLDATDTVNTMREQDVDAPIMDVSEHGNSVNFLYWLVSC